MPFKFNPFTGTFDIVNSDPTVMLNEPCNSSVSVGDAVYYLAGQIERCKADAADSSRFIGFVTFKPTTTTCNVKGSGDSGDIFAGLTVDAEHYLSESIDGAIQDSFAAKGNYSIPIGRAMSATRLFIRPIVGTKR